MCREVRCERVRDDLGERHRPYRRGSLRRAEDGPPVLDACQLAIHLKTTLEEGDPVNSQPEDLTLAQPSAGSEDHQRPVVLGHGVSDGEDGFHRQRDHLVGDLLGRPDRPRAVRLEGRRPRGAPAGMAG